MGSASSASFALVIEESMKFASLNLLQSYKVPHWLKFSGNSLTMQMSPQRNLLLQFLLLWDVALRCVACESCVALRCCSEMCSLWKLCSKMCSLCRLCCVAHALCPAWPDQVRLALSNPRNFWITESPNRPGAHFDRIIMNCEALPRNSARFGQTCWS